MALMPHWPLYTGAVKSISNANVKRALGLVGEPQKKLQNIIHIAGTNGKGSASAYCKAILAEHGYKVATYTSPHLLACNERISYHGSDISDEDLFLHTEALRHACEPLGLELTIFEATTIVAMLYFAGKNPDFCIIEAGMGGLHDATNIFEPHQVCCLLLMPVSFDHVKFLGPSKTDIVAHKIELAMGQVPVVASQQCPEVLAYIKGYCEHYGVKAMLYDEDFEAVKIELENGALDTEHFCLELDKKQPDSSDILLPMPPLKGEHQMVNLATALCGLLKFVPADFSLKKIASGITKTKWPGRLELVKKQWILNALPPQSIVYFDGAHNEGGAAVVATFAKQEALKYPDYKLAFFIGRSKDTDTEVFARHFAGFADFIFAIRSKGEVRPESEIVIESQILQALMPNTKSVVVKKAGGLRQGLELLRQSLDTKPCILFVTGSLYLAREIANSEAVVQN